MSDTRFDVVAIGNAIVDVIARADDAFLESEGLTKGSMRLIDAAEATQLYDRMGSGQETSGGSAANTVAGIAALGGKASFIGRVANDQLGQVFKHDIRALGVSYETPSGPIDPPTARCLILVTEDAQRTMNTFLGASQNLASADIEEDIIRSSAILYLEGYLWDPEVPRAAMRNAIDVARAAGRKVAFTLSDGFCVDRHRGDFRALIEGGQIDILFANEDEAMSLTETDSFEDAANWLEGKAETVVLTRSEKGATALRGGERFTISAEPVDEVVDTTGAGDLFAAGVLVGMAQGKSMTESLTMGAICAAEVISHYGARPATDLKELIAQRLG